MSERYEGSITTTLGAIHLNPTTTVAEDDSLAMVAEAFERDSVSCAVLQEAPLRVVTERDLSAAWNQGLTADDPVSRVATINPYWTPVSASIAEAAALMVSLGIRHLVVLNVVGRPTGVVSMNELFTALVRATQPMALYASFADIMLQGTSGPIAIPGSSTHTTFTMVRAVDE
jgi:signal-transduction protein with cAMP-binding, CBS, and nucleotidyltransferase domain